MAFVVVTSDMCWGIGDTEKEAVRNSRTKKGSSRVIWEFDDSVNIDDLWVDMMGNVRWEGGNDNPIVNKWHIEGGKREQQTLRRAETPTDA
jgi:hypothetical protein